MPLRFSSQEVVYAAKTFMHLTLHTLELIHRDNNPLHSTGRESSYQLFGSVGLRRSSESFSTDIFGTAYTYSTRCTQRNFPSPEHSDLRVQDDSYPEADEVSLSSTQCGSWANYP
jgi:hypothetical protein